MTEEQVINNELYKSLLENGCHYGRAKRFTHPSLKPYLIKKNKNSNIEFFNLKKSIEHLNQVANLMKEILNENKIILFVGAKPSAEAPVQEIAKKLNMPYVTYKWVGGLLTNFETIKKRIIYFKDLLAKEEKGEINDLPIYERQKIKKELDKMKKIYEGLINMENLPDYVFIVDLNLKGHKTAYRECLKKKIPVIALAGSDNDIRQTLAFIPVNDKAPRSIKFIISLLINKILNHG